MQFSRLALAALLLLAHAAAATPVVEGPGALPSALPSVLPITVRCATCRDEAPTLSLLWRAASPADAGILRSVTARDWSTGEFVLAGESGDVLLQGVAVEGGWSLSVPLGAQGLPFRVVAALRGFVADRAAWWPAQDRSDVNLSLRPLAAVLDAHPAWDPARSAECELLIPKSAVPPLVFLEAGRPRAWLFPTPGATEDVSAWTFQFVKPGASLLERVSVDVTAFDEGDSWALRVPLAATSAAATRTLPSDAGRVDVADASAASVVESPRSVTVVGVGALSLADCPRAAR